MDREDEMAEQKPWHERSFRSLRPPELDKYRTVKLVERPIGGGLPFWPFNRTRVIEVPIPPWRLRPEDPER